MLHSIPQQKWKKKEHVLKKNLIKHRILHNFQEQGKPHLQHYLQEKRSVQRGLGKAPRAGEESRILSIPVVLLQSFLTPASCKANHSAIIQVTFMLYWTKA